MSRRLSAPAGIVVLVSISVGLLLFAVWLFGSVAFESIVRRSDAPQLASFASLFGLKALPPACGLAVVRGTLIGLCILGVDAVGVWATTTYLGGQPGRKLYLQGPYLLEARWPLVVLLTLGLSRGVHHRFAYRILRRRRRAHLDARVGVRVRARPTARAGRRASRAWRPPNRTTGR